jgi:hypothetical protein
VRRKAGAFVGCIETSVRTSIVLAEVSCGLLQSLWLDSRTVPKM